MYRDFRRGTKCPGVVITRSLCNYSPGVIENDPLTGDKTLIPPLLPDDCSVSVNFNLPDLNSSVALHDVSADPSSYEFRFIELRSERIGIRERIRIRKRIWFDGKKYRVWVLGAHVDKIIILFASLLSEIRTKLFWRNNRVVIQLCRFVEYNLILLSVLLNIFLQIFLRHFFNVPPKYSIRIIIWKRKILHTVRILLLQKGNIDSSTTNALIIFNNFRKKIIILYRDMCYWFIITLFKQ